MNTCSECGGVGGCKAGCAGPPKPTVPLYTQETLDRSFRRGLAMGYVYGRADVLKTHVYGEAPAFADFYDRFEGDDHAAAYTQFLAWKEAS